jgi:putative chitinase
MNDKQKFIAELYPAARKIAQETGMSWELILAQAAQETGWGQRQLEGTNNIFNIKAHGGWDGPSKTFKVWEIEGGKKVWRDEPFRVYGSHEEALRDRVQFLKENPRYTNAGLFEEGTKGSLELEAAALQRAGYATDPQYANNLLKVFNGPTMQGALRQAQALEPLNEQVAPSRTTPPLAQTVPAAASVGSRSIYNEANEHFFQSGNRFEYGRSDLPKPGRDPSRTEQDKDGDGRLGVDCSAFIWRSLKNAGYDVRGTSADNPGFTTHTLFNGNKTTAYAKENFDVMSGTEARKPNGSLQPGDILMFKSNGGSGQHVGIFKGYNKDGQIQYIGSQGSTGPAEVTIRPGGYWDGANQEIVGALRAKPEFQVRAPLHGEPSMETTEPRNRSGDVGRGAAADGILRQGEKGVDVHGLQETLNRLGYRDAQDNPLATDGDFGKRTKESVEAYQKANGLKVDGIAGPRTLESLGKRLPDGTVTVSAEITGVAGAQATGALRKPEQAPLLSSPSHPDHALYKQALSGVEQLPPGNFKSEQERQNAAASLAFDAKVSGLKQIDHVVLSANGSSLFAVQGRMNDPAHNRVHVDKAQAAAQPIERSTQQLDQDAQQQQQQQNSQQQQAREPKVMMA